MLLISFLTYICECGESPEVTDAHQAEDEALSSLCQDVGELI